MPPIRKKELDTSAYQHLLFDFKPNGVCVVTINRPEVYNACDEVLHNELAEVWVDIGNDPRVKVVVITGAGDKAFSAGGDMAMIERQAGDYRELAKVHEEARAIVHNMVNLDKPIVSAVNGAAVGAGMAVAIMADISICSERAKFNDGHIRLGVSAGDHACAIWPLLCGMAKAKYYLLTGKRLSAADHACMIWSLLCGMAKAKYYLLTGKFIDAQTADRINLVSAVVPHERVLDEALDVANTIAEGPQMAIKYTKRAINQWLRLGNIVSFDYSTSLEILNFHGGDVKEGVKSLREKRPANFAKL